MPYPTGHRPQIRAAIIDSARRLFNRHGFDNVSLKQIMSGAGLTRGGFYSCRWPRFPECQSISSGNHRRQCWETSAESAGVWPSGTFRSGHKRRSTVRS